MKTIILLLLVGICQNLWARGSGAATTLAVSQGISYPSNSTLLNFRHGFVYQNASGVSSVDGAQISIEADDNEETDDNGVGAELAVGKSGMGLALGYYKRSCDNCEGKSSAAAGYNSGSWAIGLGYHEDDSKTLGFIYGGDSGHRFALAADLNDENETNKIQSYGLGYAFVASDYVVSVDASKRKDESTTTNDDVIQITPGVLVKTSFVNLSVSYDSYSSDDNNEYDDEVWAGIGLSKDSWDLNIYKDFVSDWAVNFVYRF